MNSKVIGQRSEKGSGTLLAAGMLVPILLFFLTIAVELNSVMQVRSIAQSRLDIALKNAILHFPNEDAAKNAAKSLMEIAVNNGDLNVPISAMEVATSADLIRSDVELKVPTFISPMLAFFTGTSFDEGLSVSVSATARAAPISLAVAFDRSLGSSKSILQDNCSSERLVAIKRIASAITGLMHHGSGRQSAIVLGPGTYGAMDVSVSSCDENSCLLPTSPEMSACHNLMTKKYHDDFSSDVLGKKYGELSSQILSISGMPGLNNEISLLMQQAAGYLFFAPEGSRRVLTFFSPNLPALDTAFEKLLLDTAGSLPEGMHFYVVGFSGELNRPGISNWEVKNFNQRLQEHGRDHDSFLVVDLSQNDELQEQLPSLIYATHNLGVIAE